MPLRCEHAVDFNSDKQCVDVDNRDILDEWMKAHPTKFYTPGKPFPLFHRLKDIFGKDQAMGAGSRSDAGAASERHSGKKQKQNDILEMMVEQVAVKFASNAHTRRFSGV
ncbi:Myb/SANT-like domain-containing protein [Arachis hypogaea]|nr:Myb/SANT-like domain-containing protein [Arachis hypogaea]